MKIYRVDVLAESADQSEVRSLRLTYPDAIAWCVSGADGYTKDAQFKVTTRREFLHDMDLSAKQIAKLLPAWAKPHFPRSIGDKVTTFYKANAKVVTGLHHSGFIVGSDEFLEWQETQPDCFRQTRDYLQNKYEHRI